MSYQSVSSSLLFTYTEQNKTCDTSNLINSDKSRRTGGSDSQGNYQLSATFTPPKGYHLYSKDIPISGIDGLGRPTLVELTGDSQIKALGDLMESVQAREPEFEPKELLVYPLGPVTLSLPVELSSGDSWIEDELEVT